MYNLKEGDIFLEKGFMSTAFNNKIIEANKKTKNKYDQNFVTTSVEIIIPKGDSVNGTYLGGIESEFLLPPDTELEIIKRDVNESGQVTLSAIIKPNI